jgi:hypothetical protein
MHKITLDDGTVALSTGRALYIPDNDTPERFPGYYRDKQGGVAWRIVGAEIEVYENWEDEFSPGCEEWRETGMLVAVMVGDDARHVFDPGDLEPLDREEFCGECGQIGCCHDGMEREANDLKEGRAIITDAA